jgi:two-component system, sensor histidine kinase and response regulator
MSVEKINVLYLDDEENNLISFKAAFRREYKVFTTTTAAEAVQILGENEIHVVISDQKMPSLSGVEFFELIIPDFPDPVRMLLTGYADIEAVIDAINKGQVFRYIPKPWNEQELKITIDNAYELFSSRQELKRKNQELQKAYQELERFVYSASHDLRAPLVSVLGILKLARAEGADEKSSEHFRMIEHTIGKLDVFVQNIINYYQNLKKGEVLRPVDFDLLADEILEQYRYYEGADKVEFRKTILQDSLVIADEMRLKMILNNLVTNGIKYRDESKETCVLDIKVTVEAGEIRIIVEDNGIGIPRENQGKVFDMFFKSSEGDPGTGIGLYIVQEAVDKMGGKIQLVSEPSKMTRVDITIPKKHD